MRLEHANNLQKGHQFHGYGLNQVNPSLSNQHLNFNDLQRITISPRDSNKDPLAIAERGKVGVPSSQSECSSNDSIEASIDSNTGILTGEKKGLFFFIIFSSYSFMLPYFRSNSS